MTSISKDLLAASSIPIVLSVLQQGESYGYEIIRKIKERTQGHLQFSDGTLYPILRKLEDKGLIASEWRVAENEKRRRYYTITDKGRDQFRTEQKAWSLMNQLLTDLWNPSQPSLT